LLGYDNYHRKNPAIPRIRFSHDRYIKNYTGNRDSKRDFYQKKVILLVRDPRDAAVSNYFQWINTVNPYKRKMLNVPERPDDVPVFDFVMKSRFNIRHTIDFLNSWAPELEKTRSSLLIRYENMREQTTPVLRSVLEFMQIDPSADELAQVVEWCSFENMKKLEENQSFSSGSRRLIMKDPDNPDAFKVRRGKIGGYRDYFTAEQTDAIDLLIKQRLHPFFGYS
jgi:hypothetical protein